ncbi:MAG TPA: tRNA pseudouridine(38-40) synthase TruA [Candidatus Nanopelagicales bacterium]
MDVGYDGTGFAGWAVQPDLRTVQGEVELALGRVLRMDHSPRIVCAGRTDTGVHARGQVAHSDVPRPAWESFAERGDAFVLRRLRSALPRDIQVARVAVAPEGFHARWSASWRRYAYRVCDLLAGPDPLARSYVLHRTGLDGAPLLLDAMNEAAQALLGEHDFAAFCRARLGASTVRTLHELHWSRDRHGLALLDVRADAFCHSMVRSLAGSLLEVGAAGGRPARPAELLAERVRDPHAQVAPAHGLVLEEVRYPPDRDLGDAAIRARRFRGDPDDLR